MLSQFGPCFNPDSTLVIAEHPSLSYREISRHLYKEIGTFLHMESLVVSELTQRKQHINNPKKHNELKNSHNGLENIIATMD